MVGEDAGAMSQGHAGLCPGAPEHTLNGREPCDMVHGQFGAERWQSGRMHRLAKPASRATGTAGSNPALSAIRTALCLTLLVIVQGACRIERTLTVHPPDDQGDVYIDGRFAGRGTVTKYLPAEGTRRIEFVREGRIAGTTIAHLDAPAAWTFPLDLVFEALLATPRAWHETVYVTETEAQLPRTRAERDVHRDATLARFRAFVREGGTP